MYCKPGKDNTFTKGSKQERIDYLFDRIIIKDHEKAVGDRIGSKILRSQFKQILVEKKKKKFTRKMFTTKMKWHLKNMKP